jgi:hypothetical protein
MNKPAAIRPPRTEFDGHMFDIAREDAPRVFAIVEESGDQHAVRVAGYGLAFDGRADVNSVEGDFRLSTDNAESALAVFGVSTGLTDVRRLHVVWLDGKRTDIPPFVVPHAERLTARSA